MEESRTQNVLKNTGTGVFVRLIHLILNFALKTVFIKVLGIQYTGVSSLFSDILTILSFAELGIGSAITYALYKPVAEDDQRQIAKLMNFYKSAYRMVAVIVFFTGVSLIPFLGYLVKDVPDIKENIAVIYFLYVVNTTCSYLLIYKSAILTAKQKKYEISCIEGFMAVIRLLVECVILLVFRQFMIYLTVDILLTILQNALIAHRASREYHTVIGDKKDYLKKEEKKIIFADIGALAMYQISSVVLSGTDSVIISAILGTELVGFLSYYKMIIGQITALSQQFFSAANASVGNMAVKENREKQYQLFQGLNFAVFWITAFCSTCLYVLFNPFIELWLGKEYVLGKDIVFVLVLDFFVSNMIRTIALFRTSNGLFIQGKFRPVIMAVLNFTMSIVLARKLGIFGVLMATVVSRLATQTWYDPWLVYREVFQKNVIEYLTKYCLYMLTAIGGIVVIEFAITLINISNSYVMFVVMILLCVVIPNTFVVIFWHRTKDFLVCVDRFKKILETIKCGGKNGR